MDGTFTVSLGLEIVPVGRTSSAGIVSAQGADEDEAPRLRKLRELGYGNVIDGILHSVPTRGGKDDGIDTIQPVRRGARPRSPVTGVRAVLSGALEVYQ